MIFQCPLRCLFTPFMLLIQYVSWLLDVKPDIYFSSNSIAYGTQFLNSYMLWEFYVATPKNQFSFVEMNVVLVMGHLE